MARPGDDPLSTDTRTGTVRDDGTVRTGTVRDDGMARTGTGARTSLHDTEMKKHRGGSTLWIVLAAVLAVLLALWLFSGAFTSDPGLDDGAVVAPGAAVDGAVTATDPVVPEGTTVDGGVVGTTPPVVDGTAPVVDGTAPVLDGTAPAVVD